MFNILTRREKHVLIIIVLTLAVLFWAFTKSLIDQQTLENWALVWLIFYVLPLGIYILTDRERRDKAEK